jgi:hypothetical protein
VIHFSVPTTIVAGAIGLALTAGTVSIAAPLLGQISAPAVTESPTPTPTAYATGLPGEGDTSGDVWRKVAPDIAPGLEMRNLPLGFFVTQNAVGFVMSYQAICTDGTSVAFVLENNLGQQMGSGNGSYCTPGGRTGGSVAYHWSDNERNAYCGTGGRVNAYRGSAAGQFSEWIAFPEQYRSCAVPQAPAPPPVAPVTPSAPAVTPSAPAVSSSTPVPTP